MLQGCQLAGSSDERVGVEGAPLALLDSVSQFLIHQRATLRQQAQPVLPSYHASGVLSACCLLALKATCDDL